MTRPAIVKIPFSAFDDEGYDVPPATAFRLYLQGEGLDPERLRVIRIDPAHGLPSSEYTAKIRVPQELLAAVTELDGAEVLHRGRGPF